LPNDTDPTSPLNGGFVKIKNARAMLDDGTVLDYDGAGTLPSDGHWVKFYFDDAKNKYFISAGFSQSTMNFRQSAFTGVIGGKEFGQNYKDRESYKAITGN